MAGKKKAPVTPPSPAQVDAAAKTSSIKQLVWLADAFHRVGARGPVQTQVPLFVAGEVSGKGYRRFNLDPETWLETDSMRVGKKEGLIFRFRPKSRIERRSTTGSMDTIEAIEISWKDVCNVFTSLADDIEKRIADVRHVTLRVDDLDKEIKSYIQKNAQMHGIITQGFQKANDLAKNQASDEVLEHIPGYGMF